jgi:hypothetical protein
LLTICSIIYAWQCMLVFKVANEAQRRAEMAQRGLFASSMLELTTDPAMRPLLERMLRSHIVEAQPYGARNLLPNSPVQLLASTREGDTLTVWVEGTLP